MDYTAVNKKRMRHNVATQDLHWCILQPNFDLIYYQTFSKFVREVDRSLKLNTTGQIDTTSMNSHPPDTKTAFSPVFLLGKSVCLHGSQQSHTDLH